MTGKTGGGKGTNQYQTRGRSILSEAPQFGPWPSVAQWQHNGGDPNLTPWNLLVQYGDLDKLAHQSELPPAILEYLAETAEDANWSLRRTIAFNPNCSAKALDILIRRNSDNLLVLAPVAAHHNASAELLDELAHHPEATVRDAVARNPTCPPEVLAYLSHDRARSVLRSVATHHHTPGPALVELYHHTNPAVSKKAWANQNFPPNVRAILALGKNI